MKACVILRASAYAVFITRSSSWNGPTHKHNAFTVTLLAEQVTAILPPKRLFGKLSPSCVQRRQEGLGKYLEDILLEMQPAQVAICDSDAVSKGVAPVSNRT